AEEALSRSHHSLQLGGAGGGGEGGGAGGAWHRALAAGPPPPRPLRLLHRTLHFHVHDYWAAIRDFSTLHDARPPDPLLFNALGLALAGAGEWRRASEVFERGAALFPRAVQLWLEGGHAFKELGAVQPALHALERAVALEESTVAYHRLASLHQLTGDHRAAMESAQRGLRGNPGDIELNHAVASALHAIGDFPSAVSRHMPTSTCGHAMPMPMPMLIPIPARMGTHCT
ncbi:unnamed protein product, partial [Closterium sp. Naga37s-1]